MLEPTPPEGVQQPQKKKRSGCLAPAIVLIVIIGIITLISLPNFLADKRKLEASRKDAEDNLAAVYAAQMAYHQKNGVYAMTFEDLNWKPPESSIYHYDMGASVAAAKGSENPATLCGNIPFPTPSGVKP